MLDLHIKISPWEPSEFFLDFWPWLRILGSMAFNFSMGVTEGPEVVFFKDYFGYNQGRPAPFLKGKQRRETKGGNRAGPEKKQEGPKRKPRSESESRVEGYKLRIVLRMNVNG